MKHLSTISLCLALLLASCSKSKDEVIPNPKLDFDFTVDMSTRTVRFENKSVGADSYQWNFGDEQLSADKAPAHTYSSEGIFTVTLVAKSLKTGEQISLQKEVVVGNSQGHLPNAHLAEPTNVDFAGCDIAWNNVNSGTGEISRSVQVSSTYNFSNIVMEGKVDGNATFSVNDLTPKTDYWIRIKTSYLEKGKAESTITYSNIKTITTSNLPDPSVSFVNTVEGASYNVFKVIKTNITSPHLVAKAVTYNLNVYRMVEKGVTAPAIPVANLSDCYIKEPSSLFVAECKVTYQNVTKDAETQSNFVTSSFIANIGNGKGWSGGYTKMYQNNGKTMLELGESETGKRVVFQIANFKGTKGAIFDLKYNALSSADGKNSINMADDTYAYLLDGASPYKYYLSAQNQRLELYFVTDTYYFFRTKASNGANTLTFTQDKDDVLSNQTETAYETYFVVKR